MRRRLIPRYAATDCRTTYNLVCFDSRGDERTVDLNGVMSDRILRTFAADGSGRTDVFLFGHGCGNVVSRPTPGE